ncbi:MAG TPA: response regulator transcription factor [Candidatus Acidoferrales bacterium]|jgi:DNA-binding NarL/FixJ family response regulator|nr:response regulator transcription factor [Candidatus Acidoferrales bacterium]
MKHTILIVDDNTLIRSSLRSWIEGNEDFQVCGEAENGMVAVQKVEEMHPDIVILDLQMPVMDGLEAARKISNIAPATAMVMFTMHPSRELLKVAQAVGVRDVVSKTDQLSDHLLLALRQICP